jgi:hypothetical protein
VLNVVGIKCTWNDDNGDGNVSDGGGGDDDDDDDDDNNKIM